MRRWDDFQGRARTQGTLTAIGSLISQSNVRAGSSLSPVREVSRSPLSNGPILGHQKMSVFRRHVEHFINFVTAQVNPIDALGEFPNKPDPHDYGWKAIWIPTGRAAEISDVLCGRQGPGNSRISESADASVSRRTSDSLRVMMID
jgi:hypothetical protein